MQVLAGFGDVNWLAVVVATVAGFLLGGLWYSPPVMGRTWMRLAGIPEDADGSNVALIMGTSLITAFVGVSALALFIGPDASAGTGALAGLVAGVGIASTAIVMNALYESRPPALMAINGGFQVVLFVVAGAILGAW